MGDQQTMDETPTSREQVYDFLVQYKRVHDGNSPSTQEIAEACNMSTTTVSYHLTRLEIDNRIHVPGNRRRMIEIIGGHWDIEEKARSNRSSAT